MIVLIAPSVEPSSPHDQNGMAGPLCAESSRSLRESFRVREALLWHGDRLYFPGEIDEVEPQSWNAALSMAGDNNGQPDCLSLRKTVFVH